MRKFIFILILQLPLYANAQFRNNIWIFGDSAGIDFSNLNNPVPISSSMDGRGTCTSIADTNGSLLFYSSTRSGFAPGGYTSRIRSVNHSVMQGGDTIIGEGWYKEHIIIPIPDHPQTFYLFSASVTGNNSGYDGLYYSIIDLSFNGGLGKVIQKNVRMTNYKTNDGLAAIKHGNGRDWWLLAREWTNHATVDSFNVFHLYLITPDSILGPFDQQIGSYSDNGFYRIEPSWDGSKIATSERLGTLELFDFDRCSGLLGNVVTIEQRRPFFTPYPSYWSCELSPDKSKLYVSSILAGINYDSTYLFQYDLNAPDIALSRDTLSKLSNIPYSGGLLELGPDGKIYYAMYYDEHYPYSDSMYNVINQNLSVINSPDSLFPFCDFQPFSFYLGGKRAYVGLPNNPNYELPAWGGSICDTLGIWNQTSITKIPTSKLHVFYHPGWQLAFINAEGLKGKNYILHIVDISGKEVFSENGQLVSSSGGKGYYTKDFHCEKLSSGIYLVLFETEEERLVKKMVIE